MLVGLVESARLEEGIHHISYRARQWQALATPDEVITRLVDRHTTADGGSWKSGDTFKRSWKADECTYKVAARQMNAFIGSWKADECTY